MFEITKIFLVIYQTLIIFRQPFQRHACHLFIILHKTNKKNRENNSEFQMYLKSYLKP